MRGRFGRSRPPGGWWILDEPELHLASDALVPDLAGLKRERLATLPQEAFLTLAPDWVLEVLSPSTASVDRVSKARIYAGRRSLALVHRPDRANHRGESARGPPLAANRRFLSW